LQAQFRITRQCQITASSMEMRAMTQMIGKEEALREPTTSAGLLIPLPMLKRDHSQRSTTVVWVLMVKLHRAVLS